jgi:DNA-binding IclR family transcriptional regulator
MVISCATGTIPLAPDNASATGALTWGRRRVHPGCVSGTDVAAGATYQSAERVLALLTSFDHDRMELGVTEMAACIGVHKSTASRLAGVLERAGLLAYGAIPVPRRLERYTDQTITTHQALDEELAAVRRNGYATAVAELEEGLVAVASPVLDGTGACVAALSVSGPAFRMRPESLDELGRLCADA